MLNPDHLQTFVAVAETGSFTAAATRLGFTQPAVSQHIRALEAQIGEVRLFRRVGKTMRLTHAGEELLIHAREVIELVERTEQHMLSLRGQVTGRVRVACAPSSGEYVLPALLAAFHRKHPAVQVAVDVGLADRLLPWLDSGRVQVVLHNDHPRRRTYDVLKLGSEEVVAVVARDHALLGQPEVTLDVLAACPLILPQRAVALRRSLEDLLRRHGIVLEQSQVVLETDSVTVAVRAASGGMGVAFVPYNRMPKTRDVGVLSLAHLGLEQAWFLVRQRSAVTNRAVDALWSFASGTSGQQVMQENGLHQGLENVVA